MCRVTCLPLLEKVTHFSTHVSGFPALCTLACASALGNGFTFSCIWHLLHIFPRLPLVPCSPALGTDSMFSRAWHRGYLYFHAWRQFACISSRALPAHSSDFMFSRAWHLGYLYFRAWHQSPVCMYSRSLPALSSRFMSSRPWHQLCISRA